MRGVPLALTSTILLLAPVARPRLSRGSRPIRLSASRSRHEGSRAGHLRSARAGMTATSYS